MKPDWQRRFDDPIPLGDGRELVTLRQAGRILLAAAEGRDFVMHARIAVARALALPAPAAEPPRRKAARKYRLIR